MIDALRGRDVTASYVHLQGLRMVPLGIPFVLLAMSRLGWMRWVPGPPPVQRLLWFTSVCVVLALGQVFGRRYERFGRVRARQRPPLLGLAALVVVGLSWAQRQLWQGPAPVSLPVLGVGVALMGLGLAHGGLRKHYVPIGAVWIVWATLDLLGVPIHVHDVAGDLAIAGALIIGGLGDHRLLVGTLHSPALGPTRRALIASGRDVPEPG